MVLVFGAACGTGEHPRSEGEIAPAAETAAAAPAGGQLAAALTDGQIAQIVVTANAIDVANGKVALARSRNERVRQFAQSMVGDHEALNESAGALVARLGVTPTASDVSGSLESDAEQTRARLATLADEEFDRAYMEHEVAYHRAVLDAVDTVLLPNASHPDLRQALTDARPLFEAHLGHAETVRDALGGT